MVDWPPLMSPYILFKVSSFSKIISLKLFGIARSNLHNHITEIVMLC